jgi:hypothetical protein
MFYSMGANGNSVAPLTAKASRDAVISGPGWLVRRSRQRFLLAHGQGDRAAEARNERGGKRSIAFVALTLGRFLPRAATAIS